MKTVLVTRAQGDEFSLRDALIESGHRVIHEPLTHVVLHHTQRLAVQHALADNPDAILVTSRHGVHALALLSELRDDYLLCVGQATAEAAESLGFSRISVTGSTVDDMVDYIMDGYDDDARFVYISGEHVRADIGQILAVRGIQVQRVITYSADTATALSDTVIEQIRRRQIDCITIMSPRAGEIWVRLAQQHGILPLMDSIEAVCISEAAANACSNAPWKALRYSTEPTLASVVESVDNA
jgi:uroporphyrinogen-III synthase